LIVVKRSSPYLLSLNKTTVKLLQISINTFHYV